MTITPKMKQFLTELAQLMEKYSVEVEATDNSRGYHSYCDGIEFYIPGKWSKFGETEREMCYFKIGTRFNSEDIKNKL